MTGGRSYDAETFRRAKREWAEGGFGTAWDEARRLSWEQGFPLPPIGTAEDQRDAEWSARSQRSIIWHALDYRPSSTIAIIASSTSWSQVVARIFDDEARLEEKAEQAEREHDEERRRWPSRSEAARALDRIGWPR
jgi:hypothetical protein